eukprot:521888_1
MAVGYYDDTIYLIGGRRNAAPVRDTYEFVPPNPPSFVYNNNALPNTEIGAYGGYYAQIGDILYMKRWDTNTIHTYNLRTNAFSTDGITLEASCNGDTGGCGACLASYADILFVVGGSHQSTPGGTESWLKTVLMLNVSSNAWDSAPQLSTAREDLSCVVDPQNGRLFAIGGYNDISSWLSSIERFQINLDDINANSWQSNGNLKSPLSYSTSVVYKSVVYVIGGSYKDGVWKYRDEVQTIDTETPYAVSELSERLSYQISDAAAIVFNDVLYAFGGYGTSGEVNTFMKYEFTSSNPTSYPTKPPSSNPISPTSNPTKPPSETPTTRSPSSAPTKPPTESPSANPSSAPTKAPSSDPSSNPTKHPSLAPTKPPTDAPTTTSPSVYPSTDPTYNPSSNPTLFPTNPPTEPPSVFPSAHPTDNPSSNPTYFNPSSTKPPTNPPSIHPSSTPTGLPSLYPSTHPTHDPSSNPVSGPTKPPSRSPSSHPSLTPTGSPSLYPSTHPTKNPSLNPTLTPSKPPTTESPSSQPTDNPSLTPTISPTGNPFTALHAIPSLSATTRSNREGERRDATITTSLPPMAVNMNKKQADNVLFVGVVAATATVLVIIIIYGLRRNKAKRKTQVIEQTIANETADSEAQHEDTPGENNVDLVKSWLTATVGLPQYHATFIENGYSSLDVVSNIATKEDLSDIGIKIKGHQTQLLAHIQKLKD